MLKREIEKFVTQRLDSRQNASLDKLHPSEDFDFILKLPRTFRERRALSIACWFLPKEYSFLKWKLILELQDLKDNTDFSNKGLLNSVQQRLLSDSEFFCLECLNSELFFSKRELFGTILQEDLKKAFFNLRIVYESNRVKRKIRRKGYQDHGTWRSPDRWLEQFDFTFNDEQNLYEKKLTCITLITLIYKIKLKEEEE